MSDYTAGKIELPPNELSVVLARLDKIEEILNTMMAILTTKQEVDKTIARPPVDFEKVKRPKVEIMEAEFIGEVQRVTEKHADRWVSALSGKVFEKGQYFVTLYHNNWNTNPMGYPRNYSSKSYANAFILLDEAVEIQHPEASVMLAAKKEKYERQ